MLQTKIDLLDAVRDDCVVSSPLVQPANLFADEPTIREFLDSVPNIYAILDENHSIVFANRALYEWLGDRRIDSVVGKRTGELFHCVNAAQHDSRCSTNEFCGTCGVLRALTSSSFGQESIQECRISQEAGEALDLRVWARPIKLQGRYYTLLSISDISHEKRRYALERVFFHDILNTASSVQGFAKLLLEMSAGQHEDMAAIISDMTNNLVEEIQAQQVLSSAESGNLSFHLATVDSLILVNETVAMYRNHDSATDRRLRLDSSSQAIEFDSDPALLRRVLGNMILNALEASSPNDKVTVGTRMGDDGVEFVVHNPQFIPREVQLQVFQRSFSTKGIGRGLGTYSMKLLSERYLQGHVSFETSPEAGTTFIARYPLQMMPQWMVA